MNTVNLYTIARGADGKNYRISRAALADVRQNAMEKTDKHTHERGLQYWDEISANEFCQIIGECVQFLGARDE